MAAIPGMAEAQAAVAEAEQKRARFIDRIRAAEVALDGRILQRATLVAKIGKGAVIPENAVALADQDVQSARGQLAILEESKSAYDAAVRQAEAAVQRLLRDDARRRHAAAVQAHREASERISVAIRDREAAFREMQSASRMIQ